MGKFNYIKVDFFGQFVSAAGASDTIHRFTYPVPKSNVDEPSNWWLDPITDPRNEIRIFNNADICYKLLVNGYGTYYSLITQNRRDSRGGMVLITVMLEKGHRVDGKMMVRLLGMLKNEMLEADQWSNDIVERCLETCGFAPSEATAATPTKQASAGMNSARAIRLYVAPEEMENYFSFPEQDAYKPYPGGILFAMGQYKPLQAVLPIVTAPLQRVFRIVKPKNCHVTGTANSLVKEGTPLRLTFKKDNFVSKPVKVVVGNKDALVSYSGSEMVITEKEGIVYYFPLLVKVSQDGQPVAPNLVKVSGSIGPRPIHFVADMGQQAVVGELFENDMEANMNAKIVINVSGNSFDPVKREVDLSQIGQPIVVNVMGRSQQVTFYHVAGGLRFSLNADIKEGTPEAQALRQGKFRGHNVTRNADGTYNIVMAEKQVPSGGQAGANSSQDDSFFKRYGKIIAVAVTILLLAALAATGLFLWKACGETAGETGRDSIQSGMSATDRGVDNPFEAENRDNVPQDNPEDVKADLALLKGDVWDRSKLLSNKCLAYYELFASGDIDGIINSDYPSQDPHNGWFEQIAAKLKELGTEEEMNGARRIMSQMAEGGKFNIEELKKKLDNRLTPLADAANKGTGNSSANAGNSANGNRRDNAASTNNNNNRGNRNERQVGGNSGNSSGNSNSTTNNNGTTNNQPGRPM